MKIISSLCNFQCNYQRLTDEETIKLKIIMKRITLLFIAIIACLLTIAAQSEKSNDSIQAADSTKQIEYVDTPAHSSTTGHGEAGFDDSFLSDFNFNTNTLIPIIAIVCVFGLPVIIVFLSFYFGYKKRKARYQLVEKALEAGQPIPEEFLRSVKNPGNTLTKGLTNTFTGIGLFIFLWGITGEFGIGCIGLLVMFMGLGQIVIHYAQEKKEGKQINPANKNDRDTTIVG